MKELLKIRVDRKLISSFKKRKKDLNGYIEKILQKEVSGNNFRLLINKLIAGYNLGTFNREGIYDRN